MPKNKEKKLKWGRQSESTQFAAGVVARRARRLQRNGVPYRGVYGQPWAALSVCRAPRAAVPTLRHTCSMRAARKNSCACLKLCQLQVSVSSLWFDLFRSSQEEVGERNPSNIGKQNCSPREAGGEQVGERGAPAAARSCCCAADVCWVAFAMALGFRNKELGFCWVFSGKPQQGGVGTQFPVRPSIRLSIHPSVLSACQQRD